jgi:hypothetical protein
MLKIKIKMNKITKKISIQNHILKINDNQNNNKVVVK